MAETLDEATSAAHSRRLWPADQPPREMNSLMLGAAALAGIPALALLIAGGLRQPGTLAALAIIAFSLLLSLWMARDLRTQRSRTTTTLVLCAAALALISAYLASGDPLSVMATSVPFGFSIAWMRPRWLPATVGLAAITVAVVAAIPLHGQLPPVRDIVLMGIYFGATTVAFAGTSISWQLQARMDQFHADQNELTLARERLRFATDLHDIQGHTMLAIKMKAELARRSLARDPDRAEQELRDIEQLAADAGSQTRELAEGYRTPNLTAELANLEQLLSAAGIKVSIERTKVLPSQHEEMFAAFVREAASNILRHSHAENVELVISEGKIRVTNDGADTATSVAAQRHGPGGPGGSGLPGLDRRFRDQGGEVSWHHEGESFTVVGTIGMAA